MQLRGQIRKMETQLDSPVRYTLPIGEERLPINPLLGKGLRLASEGLITCIHCGRKTKKSFQQGFCFPCVRRLARCDSCIVKPELCHYDAGTCREPEWGEQHCLITHQIYLANSSGLKVGITRGHSATARWIDQGAGQGLVIRRVKNRLDAGRAEVAFKEYSADRTNWRRMLQGEPDPLDLAAARDEIYQRHAKDHPVDELPGETAPDAEPLTIEYPVLEYPTKVVSHNLDKNPVLEGTLLGIKGQYLILDTAVINLRKYGGYELSLSQI